MDTLEGSRQAEGQRERKRYFVYIQYTVKMCRKGLTTQ